MKGLSYTYYQCKFLWKQEKKHILLAIVFGMLATTLCLLIGTKVYAEKMQTGIAAKVVRFHVLANSDSQQDQNLKLAVRDCILRELGEELEQCKTKVETEAFLRKSFDRIEEIAVQEIQRQGYDYTVNVSLEKTAFPLKTYGDFSFPAGVYDALRVEIGRGEGKNWWCVMYPPMCFVDASWGEVTVDSELRLKGTLTEEEFTLVHAEKEGIRPKVKFKIVEWWQERS